MPHMPVTIRPVGRRGSELLELLAARRRRSLNLSVDRGWLAEELPGYEHVLRDLTANHALHRVSRGAFVVAEPGTDSGEQSAPIELLIDLTLRGAGDYYLTCLSALIRHQLTDLHSLGEFVAIPTGRTRTGATNLRIGEHTVRLIRLSRSRWPRNDRERKRRRVIAGTKEFSWCAGIERALVDALMRPEMSAGFETVATSWARAKHEHAKTDWDLVWTIARRLGIAMEKRAAFMLSSLGFEDLVEPDLPRIRGNRTFTPLDRTHSYESADERPVRDATTGVGVNVPSGRLRGWLQPRIG